MRRMNRMDAMQMIVTISIVCAPNKTIVIKRV